MKITQGPCYTLNTYLRVTTAEVMIELEDIKTNSYRGKYGRATKKTMSEKGSIDEFTWSLREMLFCTS